MEDLEELVAFMTPREENEAIKSYQNTTAVACPACDEPFDNMIVCKQELTSLNLTERLDFCVGIYNENPIIFTHKL